MEDNLAKSFGEIFGSSPEVYSSAPGRINLIGEHTDYNLGYVLPAAIDLHIAVLASRRKDRMVRVWADSFEQEKRRRQIEETLRTAAEMLNQSLDINQVLTRIISQIQMVVPCDTSSIQQVKDDCLEIIAANGFDDVS